MAPAETKRGGGAGDGQTRALKGNELKVKAILEEHKDTLTPHITFICMGLIFQTSRLQTDKKR